MRRAVGAVVVMAMIGGWNLAGEWLVRRDLAHDVPGGIVATSPTGVTDRAPAPAAAPGRTRRPPPALPDSFSRDPLTFLSTAPPESLDLLPGVGPVLAARIVEARGRGPFTSWDDVLAVKGIGPRTVARWQAPPRQ
jgi:hypothetical protein